MAYKTRSQIASSLFCLPRELRDHIWDYALCGTGVHILKEEHVITLAYPSPNLYSDPEPDVNFPRWLLASKQTLSEGLEQFARSGTCTRIAPHMKPWTSAFAVLAISRDTLLMPQIRNLSLHLQLCVSSNDYDARIEKCIVGMSISASPKGESDPQMPSLCKCGFTILEFLPNAENLHLRLLMTGLHYASHPNRVNLNATNLRCLGTAWKLVRISILKPVLEVHLRFADDAQPYLVLLASMYLRVQKALFMLSGHLTRHLGRLPPAGPEEEWPSAEYRESGFWHLSEVDMHPCEEFEPSGYEEVERWFKVEDSMDKETGEWCLKVEEELGKGEVQCMSKVLQHTGLRDWVHVPKLGGRNARRRYFKRDAVAKVGGHVSWTCEETGRAVWIEDNEQAMMGYMRIGEDLR